MSIGFFQTELDPAFERALASFNEFDANAKSRGAFDLDELISAIKNLDQMGLYDRAMTLIQQIPADAVPADFSGTIKLIERKFERKQRIFDSNLQNNFDALRQSFPHLSEILRTSDIPNIAIAGDSKTGYRLLSHSNAGFNDITLPGSVINTFRLKLEKKIEDFKKTTNVFLSNFRLSDVFLWLAERTRHDDIRPAFILYIAETNEEIFSAVLRTHDFSRLFFQKRIVPFVGDGVFKQLTEWHFGNLFAGMPENFNCFPEIDMTAMEETCRSVYKALSEKSLRLQKEIKERYENISDTEWKHRYETGEIKILLFTTRHSTFAQYCVRDMAGALKKLGYDAVVYIEPDETSRITVISIVDAVVRHCPDLVVQIDHHRYECETAYPKPLPYVTWIQDPPVPQIRDADPDIFGRHDFLFTPFIGELEKFGYERENLLPLIIPASEDVYHPGGLTDDDLSMYSCDVAYVSHVPSWSDIVEPALRDETSFTAALFRRLEYRLNHDMNSYIDPDDFTRLVAEVGEELGVTLEKHVSESYANWLALDGFGRMLPRVIPMEWIAAMGVDLRLYGANWSEIPSLSAYARGTIQNGEPLRKAYQAAKINIAISTHWSMHMRIFECMLSGGFVLVKDLPRHKDALSVHDYFDIGEELCVFKDRNDLIEKIRFFLDNPDRRKEIAERGRQKVLEQFTFTKQMKFMMDAVRERICATPQK